jgi:hypothetical protein
MFIYAHVVNIFERKNSMKDWWPASRLNLEPRSFLLNPLKTPNLETLIFLSQTLITRGKMFMPTRSIFLKGQTSFRIDGRPPDWISRPEVLVQIYWKQPSWRHLYFRLRLLLPKARCLTCIYSFIPIFGRRVDYNNTVTLSIDLVWLSKIILVFILYENVLSCQSIIYLYAREVNIFERTNSM